MRIGESGTWKWDEECQGFYNKKTQDLKSMALLKNLRADPDLDQQTVELRNISKTDDKNNFHIVIDLLGSNKNAHPRPSPPNLPVWPVQTFGNWLIKAPEYPERKQNPWIMEYISEEIGIRCTKCIAPPCTESEKLEIIWGVNFLLRHYRYDLLLILYNEYILSFS